MIFRPFFMGMSGEIGGGKIKIIVKVPNFDND